MGAAFGDDPGPQPRDADRPAGQPGPRRRADADEQAGRHRRHPRGPGRGDRRRRRPLHAGPLERRQPRSTSTWTCGPGRPATTRSSTCSTPRPAPASVLRNAAELGIAGPTRARSTWRCSPTRARATCCSRSPSSPGRRLGRRAARAAPGRPLPRGEGRQSAHRFYDACRVLPKGDEEVAATAGARLLLLAGHPDRPRERPRACWASRAPERM